MTTPITWTGDQAFRVVGSNLHEDTLRVRSNYDNKEIIYRLRLPTLCVTYADMRFANDIGGMQERWPDSTVYGPKYFDPPVVINGHAEVERLTWIRGAHRVVIGPKETVIEWRSYLELVVPRLRISEREPIEALLQVDNAVVNVEPQLLIDITQSADGRRIGGVRVVKRHPDWREPPLERPTYRLWVRVVDFANGSPLVEAKVALLRWKGRPPSPKGYRGEFVPLEQVYTDGTGSVVREQRPAEVLEAATLAMDGWRATAKVWSAQANQPVNVLMTATRLESSKYPDRVPGAARNIYAAAYHLDPGDALEWLAETFRYQDVAELANLNNVATLDTGLPVPLPGWYFVHAQAGDTVDSIAKEFELEPRWPRPTGRHHRPNPSVLIEHEIVALPDHHFTEGRRPGQL